MTVCAIVLAGTPDSAIADADGMPAVRRIADVAWSGGAVPIVVVAADPDGAVAAALAGSAVTLAAPAPAERGAVGQIIRGIEVAAGEIRDTDGAIIWPAGFTWVGPETVTSLIEAFGTQRAGMLRPSYDETAGWPVLVATAHAGLLARLDAERMPDDVLVDLAAALDADGAPIRTLELGDPGTIYDRSTPRSQLPAYTGPSEPAGGHVHEWGAAIADHPDDSPLAGPALAPYGQAVAEDPDQPG